MKHDDTATQYAASGGGRHEGAARPNHSDRQARTAQYILNV